MKVVRDAVHGDIELTAAEVSVLDTPEVQRLRGIKQLGTAHLVYPSAVHTRFEHSLGALHLAGRVLDALDARRGDGEKLPAREREATRLAALLHDVTHIPFGHTFEDERRIFERHDTAARTLHFLRSGELAARLDRTGLREDVERILAGTPARPERPYTADIVRGTIGADLLDYLARDSYFCGFRTMYDERVFRTFALAPSGGPSRLVLAVVKGGLVRNDALTEILSLLRLRYALCERVYYHHAKVAAGAAVSKAVEIAVNLGLVLEDLYPLRDEGLFRYLRERFPGSRPLATLLGRLEARRLGKRAYVLTRRIGAEAVADLVRRFHLDRPNREAAEADVAKAVGVKPEDAIVYCPAPAMAAKEADAAVIVDPAGPPRTLASLRLPEVDALVEKHRDLWRFYVFLAAEHRDRLARASRACEEYFGHGNELEVLERGQLRFGF